MLPENPFLQLTLPRIQAALRRVELQVWREITPVRCFFGASGPDAPGFDEAVRGEFREVSLPFVWGRLFDSGWFRVEIPDENTTEAPRYLHWQEQGESTLYVDGVPFYGFDVAHRYCALPAGTREVFLESLCLQSAIWHPQATGLSPEGSRLESAVLCERNDLAWEVLHDFQVLFELVLELLKTASPMVPPKVNGVGYQPPLDIIPPDARRLLRGLENAVNAFDCGGLPAARESLKSTYRKMADRHDPLTAVLTGHAHIDLVWLWPERSGEAKAVHTFSTMNRLMDLYPEFIFGYSQPASYRAVERISPPLFECVRSRIASGRWEPVGATEVESDTLIACGEALVRSFLIGQKEFQRLGGSSSRILWLPDVFGYCSALPQIMRQCGVDFFFTTKLTWSNINRFPFSSFVWRGVDGSEVLVHVTQENGYNQEVRPEPLRRGADAYRQSDVHDQFLAPSGFGDGGGGVTEEMCERARRMSSLAGLPAVRWGRVDSFFEGLDDVRDKLPTWQGELYLEYHRGVLTTHGELKSRFRECERALQAWEATRCVTGLGPIAIDPWRRLVFAQFHDYIPGSSIWEVYEKGVPELASIAGKAFTSATDELTNGLESALFNPLPVPRIFIDDESDRIFQIPPLSGFPRASLPEVIPARPVRVAPRSMESGSVSVEFDTTGRISFLSFGGRSLPLTAPMAAMALYPDHPHAFDAWEIDRATLALGTIDSQEARARSGGGGATGWVEFERPLGKQSSVITRYWLDAIRPVLHVEFSLTWAEKGLLLKALFPTGFSGRMARFGSPFGSILRGQQPGPLRDEAQFEGAASRWAIVSDDGESFGLGVVTESKYGFSCREGQLGVSLVRSAKVTGEDDGHRRVVSKTLRRRGKRAVFSDLGSHRIRLALCAHGPEIAPENAAPALADSLFLPFVPYQGGEVKSGFRGITGPVGVVPSWAKPADDGWGWILRLHETLGHRGTVDVLLDEGYSLELTRLDESCGRRVANRIEVKPYELVSLRIVPVG